MFQRIMYFSGIAACLLMAISCFLPWAHYRVIDETFTGFHVLRFPSGNYYGKAGILITILTSLVFVLFLLPYAWARRVNLFISAVLLAFTLRTYVIFTGELFKGDVEKKIGIYLILICSILIMAASIFAKNPAEKKINA